MAGIEKLEGHLRIVVRGFPEKVAAPSDGSRMPRLRAKIHSAVREKRILGDPVILPLAGHHIDRIVQHDPGDARGLLGHKNPGLGFAAGEDRQAADVVLMRVRDKDRIHFSLGHAGEVGYRREPFQLRMQPRVEDDILPPDAQPIRIGSDFRAPRQVHQFHSRPNCRTSPVCSMKIPPAQQNERAPPARPAPLRGTRER